MQYLCLLVFPKRLSLPINNTAKRCSLFTIVKSKVIGAVYKALYVDILTEKVFLCQIFCTENCRHIPVMKWQTATMIEQN